MMMMFVVGFGFEYVRLVFVWGGYDDIGDMMIMRERDIYREREFLVRVDLYRLNENNIVIFMLYISFFINFLVCIIYNLMGNKM